jgi:hypothetical protein
MGKLAIVCERTDGATVWQRNSQGGLGLRSRVSGWAMDAKFSLAGHAFIAGSGIREVPLPSDTTRQLLDPVPEGPVYSVAVSVDGTHVAWIAPSRQQLVLPGSTPYSLPGELGIINVKDNSESWRTPTNTPLLPTIYFLNGRSYLLAGPSLFLLDLSTKQLRDTRIHSNQFLALFPSEEVGLMTVVTKDGIPIGDASIEPAGVISVMDTIQKGIFCNSAAISSGKKALAAVFQIATDDKHVEQSIVIWDLTTRERVRQWICPDASSVAWSPIDGNLLVGGARLLRLYRFADSGR